MDKHVINRNRQKWFGYGVFAVMFVAILAVRIIYGTVIAVSGTSMVPTFNDGDFVFGTVIHDDTELNVGDIVILEQDNKYLIKRIYGTPGATISPDYVKNIPAITLGDSEYYVLGDNWKNSRDSREFGPVTRDNIKFKYAGIHWSKLSLIISLFIPAVLFVFQMSIVFIPADEPKKKKKKSDEITSGATPANDTIDDDIDKELDALDSAEEPEPLETSNVEEAQSNERSA